MKDLSKKNEVDGYTRKFDTTTIPLDGSLSDEVGIKNFELRRKLETSCIQLQPVVMLRAVRSGM